MRHAYAAMPTTLVAVFLTAPATTGAAQNSPGSIPVFSGAAMGWLAMGTDFKPVPGGPQPVTDDPAHPHVGTTKADF